MNCIAHNLYYNIMTCVATESQYIYVRFWHSHTSLLTSRDPTPCLRSAWIDASSMKELDRIGIYWWTSRYQCEVKQRVGWHRRQGSRGLSCWDPQESQTKSWNLASLEQWPKRRNMWTLEKNKRTDLRKVCKNLHHVQAKSVNRATFQTSAHAYPDKSTS